MRISILWKRADQDHESHAEPKHVFRIILNTCAVSFNWPKKLYLPVLFFDGIVDFSSLISLKKMMQRPVARGAGVCTLLEVIRVLLGNNDFSFRYKPVCDGHTVVICGW